MYRRSQPNYYETALESAFYQSLSKVFWGIAIAWIIFSCQQKQGYFLRSFLELPIFQIISKLSFSMGLTHVVIQIILVASQRQPGLFQNNHLVNDCYRFSKFMNCLDYIYFRFINFWVILDLLWQCLFIGIWPLNHR